MIGFIFLAPHPSTMSSLALVVTGIGAEGLESAARLFPSRTGIPLPDWGKFLPLTGCADGAHSGDLSRDDGRRNRRCRVGPIRSRFVRADASLQILERGVDVQRGDELSVALATPTLVSESDAESARRDFAISRLPSRSTLCRMGDVLISSSTFHRRANVLLDTWAVRRRVSPLR